MFYGFITVRTSSSRLPKKCLLPFGEMTVIEHVVMRTKSYGLHPIICTSKDPSDSILGEIAQKHDVDLFRGALENKLLRWADCATAYNIDSFHTIDADDLFFDGAEMIESLKLLNDRQVDIVQPSKISANGAGSVGYSLKKSIIKGVLDDVTPEADTEMFWKYFEGLNYIQTLTMPDNPNTPKKLRLTLDYIEDYWLLESVRRILGGMAPRSEIDALFRNNPDLHKVNWFRNAQWKMLQAVGTSMPLIRNKTTEEEN